MEGTEFIFFFSSRRRHTRWNCDWSSDVCSSDLLGAGTADGRVALQQVRFRPRYAEQKLVDLEIEVRDRGVVEIDPGKRPIREVSYAEHEGRKAVAALVSDDEIALYRTSEEGEKRRDTLKTEAGEKVTHLRLGRTDALV